MWCHYYSTVQPCTGQWNWQAWTCHDVHQSSRRSSNGCISLKLIHKFCGPTLLSSCWWVPTHTVTWVEKAFQSKTHGVMRLGAQLVMLSCCVQWLHQNKYNFLQFMICPWSQVLLIFKDGRDLDIGKEVQLCSNAWTLILIIVQIFFLTAGNITFLSYNTIDVFSPSFFFFVFLIIFFYVLFHKPMRCAEASFVHGIVDSLVGVIRLPASQSRLGSFPVPTLDSLLISFALKFTVFLIYRQLTSWDSTTMTLSLLCLML